ncbi:MAG: FliH/SctL family protein [Rickettsiales bacterium]
MRIERFDFTDFETSGSGAVIARRKRSLPGGRRKEEEPPPPPAPTFSEDDIKAAERDGYQKGFLEGIEEGKKQAESEQADIDRKLSETVERFVSSIAPLLNDYRAMQQQMREDMPKVALAISKKVAGDALESNAESMISGVALACVEAMIGEPKLSITVHSSVADTLEKKLTELASRVADSAQFTVGRDENMNIADCRMEWKYGAMERHTGQLWEQVEKVVESMVTSAQRETDTNMEQLEQQLPKE